MFLGSVYNLSCFLRQKIWLDLIGYTVCTTFIIKMWSTFRDVINFFVFSYKTGRVEPCLIELQSKLPALPKVRSETGPERYDEVVERCSLDYCTLQILWQRASTMNYFLSKYPSKYKQIMYLLDSRIKHVFLFTNTITHATLPSSHRIYTNKIKSLWERGPSRPQRFISIVYNFPKGKIKRANTPVKEHCD